MRARGLRGGIRRIFNWLTLLSTVIAPLLLVAWMHTLRSPLTFYCERNDWDLGEFIKLNLRAVTLLEGRWITVHAPSPEAVGPTIKQTDWTFGHTDTQLALSSWQDPSRVHSLLWPIVVALVLPALWMLARLRAGAKPEVRRLTKSARLARALAGLSLLLIPIAAISCYRSFPYFERIDLRLLPGLAALQVNSSRGSLMFAWTESGPHRTLTGGRFLFVRSTIPPGRGPLHRAAGLVGDYLQIAGFTLGTDGTTILPRNVIIVPYAFVLIVLLAVSIWLWRIYRRLARRDLLDTRTLCACGYDLRGSTERCPECGRAIEVGRTLEGLTP